MQKRRYHNEAVQMMALGLREDYSDYMGNQIKATNDMAGMPRDVKMLDFPEREAGFNRTVPNGESVIVIDFKGM